MFPVVEVRRLSVKAYRFIALQVGFEDHCRLCGKAMRFLEQRVTKSYHAVTCKICRRAEKARIHSNNTGRRIKRLLPEVGKITFSEWMHVLMEHKFACAHCGKKGRKNLTLDHKVTIKDGGLNRLHNIQPLCVRCHAKKDNARSSLYRRIRNRYRRLKFRCSQLIAKLW